MIDLKSQLKEALDKKKTEVQESIHPKNGLKINKDGTVNRSHFNKRTPGTGAQPGGIALARRLRKQMLEDALNKMVILNVRDPKSGKIVPTKKEPIIWIIEKVFHEGMGDSYSDRKEWLDRALGRPIQPIVGDEDEAPVQVNIGAGRILDRAYGTNQDTDEGA